MHADFCVRKRPDTEKGSGEPPLTPTYLGPNPLKAVFVVALVARPIRHPQRLNMKLATQDFVATTSPDDKVKRAIVAALSLTSSKATKAEDQEQWLAVGELLHSRRRGVKSVKVFGIQLKADIPEIAALPSSARTDATWLFLKMSSGASETFLQTIGVENLSDLRIGHPSTIRRLYNKKLQAN